MITGLKSTYGLSNTTMSCSCVTMMSFKSNLSESIRKSNLVVDLISCVIFLFVAKYTVPEEKPVPL